MIKVIGVRFRTAGKIYFFDPLDFDVKRNDHVIVETVRGVEYGTVVGDPKMVVDDEIIQPLKPVLRVATPKDDEQEAANKLKEKDAFKICLEKIQKHGLEMKLIDAEYTFDNNKVLFYFTADGRIDFRELVKDLASVFRTRIELRQIGVRDETKILGGIGICGRPLCCHTHLSEFVPVSIKMAKEQNLSLNPTKISGVCGRLMCCLKHEEETYEELNKKLPNIGDTVTTSDGFKGEVQSVSVLRQLVKIIVENEDEKEIREYHVDQLKFKKRQKKESMNLSAEELKELQKLEQEEQNDSKIEDANNAKDFPKYARERKDSNREFNKELNKDSNKDSGRDATKENYKEGRREFGKDPNKETHKEFGSRESYNKESARDFRRDNRDFKEKEYKNRESREDLRENEESTRENTKENRRENREYNRENNGKEARNTSRKERENKDTPNRENPNKENLNKERIDKIVENEGNQESKNEFREKKEFKRNNRHKYRDNGKREGQRKNNERRSEGKREN